MNRGFPHGRRRAVAALGLWAVTGFFRRRGTSQGRGSSGILLMGLYEIQVLDA